MDSSKDPKAKVNPAARHDAPGSRQNAEAPAPKKDEQVKGKQESEMNPLEPGGIGD